MCNTDLKLVNAFFINANLKRFKKFFNWFGHTPLGRYLLFNTRTSSALFKVEFLTLLYDFYGIQRDEVFVLYFL